MTEVLGDFIRALRAADVRVSTSESIDAGNVVDLVGLDDRTRLRDGLSQVLAKSEYEKEAFRDTFDRFFAFDQFKSRSAGEASEEEQGEGDESEGGNPSQGQSGGMPGPGGGGMEGEPSGDMPSAEDLVAMLESGDQAALQMALAEAAREAQLNRIRLFTQRGMYVRRMMEIMGLNGLQDEIERREDSGEQGPADALRGLRDQLRADVRDYVEKQLEIFTANSGRQLREEVLSQVRLGNIDMRDMKIMRGLVAKMAKRLVALHSRRKKVDKRGQLDVRRTIRANVEYDGLLFHTIWKQEKIDRPKVMAICDVSGSVAQVARFLLMFLYSIQEVLPRVRSFAFSGELGEVTQAFETTRKIEDAITGALREHGGGSTDYGQAFVDFERLALDDVDHRTTVLILGDARSNYGNPRGDILKKIHARARRVIWLNPEPQSMWNSGDSEMKRLQPYCDSAKTCASLKDLERVVSELLRHAS
ncbi:MAG: VWA domain-containing protein [Parvibaculum sp.]|uniref:VWA domain-containing protein n=1 Tax=Parvibaculum sp. TaxID=2024848 RepID=UPI0025D7C9DE|nr:VWA domain-containing protein [Parvibaculum sp.]MCE9649142.1 VWA domain-containing protein [Parvibaculum sp.]